MIDFGSVEGVGNENPMRYWKSVRWCWTMRQVVRGKGRG